MSIKHLLTAYKCIKLSYPILYSDEEWILRLVGDPFKKAVVELFDGYEWGRICVDGDWKLKMATYVCRHLGYEKALGALSVQALIPEERKPIF